MQRLKVKKAQMGISANVSLDNEIEDIESEIKRLHVELDMLEDYGENESRQPSTSNYYSKTQANVIKEDHPSQDKNLEGISNTIEPDSIEFDPGEKYNRQNKELIQADLGSCLRKRTQLFHHLSRNLVNSKAQINFTRRLVWFLHH